MKYLDYVELLSLVLQLLKSEQCDQVPLSKLSEMQALVMGCMERSEDFPMMQARCNDLLMSISVAQGNQAVLYLPRFMRDVLVQGV